MGIQEDRKVRIDGIASLRREMIAKAQSLKTAGYSNATIAQDMNVSESTVRFLLKPTPESSEHWASLELGEALTDSGHTVERAVRMIKDTIRKEQGFNTDQEAQDYWFSLPFADKIELTKRVVK